LTLASVKNSEFRKSLLQYCKDSFDHFFDKEAIHKVSADEEEKLKFKERLFGNI
jgi:hypothetical protein